MGLTVVVPGRRGLVPEAVVVPVAAAAIAVVVLTVVVLAVIILAVVVLTVVIVLAVSVSLIAVVTGIVQGGVVAVLVVGLAEKVAGGNGAGFLSVVARRSVLVLAVIAIRVVLGAIVRVDRLVVLGRIVLSRGGRADGQEA